MSNRTNQEVMRWETLRGLRRCLSIVAVLQLDHQRYCELSEEERCALVDELREFLVAVRGSSYRRTSQVDGTFDESQVPLPFDESSEEV